MQKLEDFMRKKRDSKIAKNEKAWMMIKGATIAATLPLTVAPTVFGGALGSVAALGIPVLEGSVVASTLTAVRAGYVAG